MNNSCADVPADLGQQCSCCGKSVSNHITIAERLLDLAKFTSYPQEVLLIPPEGATLTMPTTGITIECMYARTALALVFNNKPKAFILRAIVENWSAQRLLREMY